MASLMDRFTPIYHVKASEMKPILKQQRIEESQRAILFRNLTTERIRRRVREWSIRALKERRIQLLKVYYLSLYRDFSYMVPKYFVFIRMTKKSRNPTWRDKTT